jgi:hypothetical protein
MCPSGPRVIIRGLSRPSAKTEISNPGGKAIDFPGTPYSSFASSGSELAVAAGASDSRLGLPMLKVQALTNPSIAKNNTNIFNSFFKGFVRNLFAI